MRPFFVLSTALLAVLASAALGAAPTGETVALKTVKYADLGRTIRDLQGKIVVVDFWGEY